MRAFGGAASVGIRACVLVSTVLVPVAGRAQPADPLRVTLPPVKVTAQKEPTDKQELPASVTAVTQDTLASSGITTLSEAGVVAPNTFFSDFQARKLSFPRFRGVSSGPGNPAITTYVDGVPMIHTNATSVELIDVEQVEFVRGGQSALYGRNALGGIMTVASARPSLSRWTGGATVPIGNYGSYSGRGTVSGPVTSRSAISVSAGRSVREGFTSDTVRGTDIDTRASSYGKAQLLWLPTAKWEARVIVSGERARDGDYALSDLAGLRRRPFETTRSFQGATERDVLSAAVLVRREGQRVTLSTTTGVVRWDAKDDTDLDYSRLPLLSRTNDEKATQFTQEVRLASAPNAPVSIGGGRLRWQGGVFLFTQGYEQNAVNAYAPLVLSQALPFGVRETSPQATLDDLGIGVYGQGTITFRDRLDVSAGGRFDHEQKDATIDSFFTPPIAPPNHVVSDRSFSNVAPQLSVAFRERPERMIYASIGSGYKAGGFNAASPRGAEAFQEEHTWQVEGGVKTTWVGGRVQANVAIFHIDWEDLQLNLPNPQVPAQFYIANVGGARSTGLELELSARAASYLDVFGSVGFTNGRFKDGSMSSGAPVGGNALPSTPDYTTTVGAQLRRPLTGAFELHARGEVEAVGAFSYDDANLAGQDAYTLTNLRAGIKRGVVSVDGWVRNAFDTRYVPVAFTYPGLAPSGFIGEMGRPRTFGVSMGVQF